MSPNVRDGRELSPPPGASNMQNTAQSQSLSMAGDHQRQKLIQPQGLEQLSYDHTYLTIGTASFGPVTPVPQSNRPSSSFPNTNKLLACQAFVPDVSARLSVGTVYERLAPSTADGLPRMCSRFEPLGRSLEGGQKKEE